MVPAGHGTLAQIVVVAVILVDGIYSLIETSAVEVVVLLDYGLNACSEGDWLIVGGFVYSEGDFGVDGGEGRLGQAKGKIAVAHMSAHWDCSIAELKVAFMQFVPVELRSKLFRFAQIHLVDKDDQIVQRGAGGIADLVKFLPEHILMRIDKGWSLTGVSKNDGLGLFYFLQHVSDGIVVEVGLQAV